MTEDEAAKKVLQEIEDNYVLSMYYVLLTIQDLFLRALPHQCNVVELMPAYIYLNLAIPRFNNTIAQMTKSDYLVTKNK